MIGIETLKVLRRLPKPSFPQAPQVSKTNLIKHLLRIDLFQVIVSKVELDWDMEESLHGKRIATKPEIDSPKVREKEVKRYCPRSALVYITTRYEADHSKIPPGTSRIKTPEVAVKECDDKGHMPSDKDDIGSESHIQELQRHIHILQNEKDDHAKIIAGLRNDLKVKAARCKLIGESADNMLYALENKELYIGRQASDNVLYVQFQELVEQIQTWSVSFAPHHPQSHLVFAAEVMNEFRKVAPGVRDVPSLLQTTKNLRLFVRGYVGLVLADMIFRAWPSGTQPKPRGEDVWMDKNLAHGVFLVESRLSNAGKLTFCHCRMRSNSNL